MLYVVYFCFLPLGGGDIFWQIRAGEEILRTWVVPVVEAWSYTVPGAPWNNHEWAGDAGLVQVQPGPQTLSMVLFFAAAADKRYCHEALAGQAIALPKIAVNFVR
jgi:hypothetical protein